MNLPYPEGWAWLLIGHFSLRRDHPEHFHLWEQTQCWTILVLSSWPFTDRATLSRGKASTVAAGFRLSQQFDGLAHVVGLACLQGMLSPGARQCTFEEAKGSECGEALRAHALYVWRKG